MRSKINLVLPVNVVILLIIFKNITVSYYCLHKFNRLLFGQKRAINRVYCEIQNIIHLYFRVIQTDSLQKKMRMRMTSFAIR